MKKIFLVIALTPAACVSYHQVGTPTVSRQAASRQCVARAIQKTEIADYFGLIGGIVAAPERDRIADDCMLEFGYAKD